MSGALSLIGCAGAQTEITQSAAAEPRSASGARQFHFELPSQGVSLFRPESLITVPPGQPVPSLDGFVILPPTEYLEFPNAFAHLPPEEYLDFPNAFAQLPPNLAETVPVPLEVFRMQREQSVIEGQ
ncbi:MAG: hypothetical protein PVI23_08515 [Maricaulaceae bacterium]|jgi:hypothetical protein